MKTATDGTSPVKTNRRRRVAIPWFVRGTPWREPPKTALSFSLVDRLKRREAGKGNCGCLVREERGERNDERKGGGRGWEHVVSHSAGASDFCSDDIGLLANFDSLSYYLSNSNGCGALLLFFFVFFFVDRRRTEIPLEFNRRLLLSVNWHRRLLLSTAGYRCCTRWCEKLATGCFARGVTSILECSSILFELIEVSLFDIC